MPRPPAIGHYAADVAWESADAVLIATNSGVHRFSLRNRKSERLISNAPLPDGVPDPQAVASDGATVTATSAITMGGYSMRLADQKRLIAQRIRLQPLDVAVRGQRTCVLAREIKKKTNDAVFADRSMSSGRNLRRCIGSRPARRFSRTRSIVWPERLR